MAELRKDRRRVHLYTDAKTAEEFRRQAAAWAKWHGVTNEERASSAYFRWLVRQQGGAKR